ncbi:serine/threonine protein kinase (plasmid) [Myxococcus stipitatus]|uniref:protein kinase domain-containing protein n=1 Tax=Myxococcus stipitatus TaxID=83455 RepID=UPI003145591F
MIDDDIPPEMPELDEDLLDSLALSELDESEPLPPLLPPPPPIPPGEEPPPPAPKTSTRTGQTLTTPAGPFTILRRLGAGGMGEVFLARKQGSASWNKDVALKRIVTSLRREDDIRKLFVDEARLAAHLNHPGIASVFDLIEREHSYILVMEFIPGNSVRELLNLALMKRTSFSEGFALYITSQTADALAYAHELIVDGKHLGIVHRDVSPQNLMLTTSGAVKLLDFGVAFSHLEGRDKTQTGIVKGKTSYMSPEQATGAEGVDGRSDQFALAIVAVELLTGKRLFDSPTKNETSTLLRIASCPPDLIASGLSSLSPALAPIFAKALSKHPDERWPTCLAFAEALRDHLLAQQVRFGPAQALAELSRIRALPDAAATVASGAPRAVSVPPAPPAPPLQPRAEAPPAPAPAPVASPPAPPAAVPASPPKSPEKHQEEADSVSISVVPPSPAAPAGPGATTQARQKLTRDALYSPPKARRTGVIVPVVGFVAVAAITLIAVRLLTSSSSGSAAPASVEEMKTPAQQRAERELEEKQLTATGSTPPTLTDAPQPSQQPAESPSAPPNLAPAAPAPQPTLASSENAPAQQRTRPRAPSTSRTQAQAVPAATSPTTPFPAAATASAAPPLRDLSFRSSAGTGAPSSAPPSGNGSALGVPRGAQVAVRLDGVADPVTPGPVTVILTKPLLIGGRTVIPQGARAVCDVGSVTSSRLAVTCDTLNIGGQAHAFSGLLYGLDGRAGLPISISGGTESTTANAAVSTGERVTRSIRPGGVVGELVDGLTDAAGNTARRATSPSATTMSAVPRGTSASLFVVQAF